MHISKSNAAKIFIQSTSTELTAKRTTKVLNYLCKLINETNINTFKWSEINHNIILDLRFEFISKNLKPASINTYISALKSVSREAWRLNQISTETYMRIKDVQRVKGSSIGTGRYLRKEELKSIVNYKPEVPNSTKQTKLIRDSAILAITYGLGLRANEVTTIEICDYKNNKIIVNGKGSFITTMHMPEFAIKALNKWICIRGDYEGKIFSTLLRGGKLLRKGISTRTVADIIQERHLQAGILKFTPHDLRRSFATNLLNAGVDLSLVQKLMRHKKIETTRIYDMRGEEEKEEAIKQLPF